MPALWPAAVVVDLDNTLHDYKAAARTVRAALARLVEQKSGIPQDLVLERYEQLIASEADAAFASGRELRMARMRTLLDTWPETRGAEPAPFADYIEATLFEAIRPFDGAMEAYRAIDGKGRMLVLTEGYADTQEAIARRLGLSVEPNKFLSTKTHGVRKKDGSAFRLARERLGVPADDIVMVGDNWSWDILGAAMAGMWQVWVAADAEGGRDNPPDGYLGRVSAFRDVPAFLASTWARPTAERTALNNSSFKRSYAAELQRHTPPEAERALIASLQSEIETAAMRAVFGNFHTKYPVLHVMNVGSTSRGTYAAFPADFDIVIDTACEQTRIAPGDARQLCETVLETVVMTDAFQCFVDAIGRKVGLNDFRPRVQLESFGVRGPQSLVARYDLVARTSAAQGPRVGFLDVSFGLLPQIIGYEVSIRRLFERLGPLRAERLRSEIRLAKSLLKTLGLYGSSVRGLRAHAVEQWVIQCLDYRASGLTIGTLENALRLIVEECGAPGSGRDSHFREFHDYMARFPLRHPGWSEIAAPQSDRRNVNLWDLLGDGVPALATQKWRKLVALALVFERFRKSDQAWDIETLARFTEAILSDNTATI